MEGLLVSCTCGETVRNGQYRAHAAGESTDMESSVAKGRVMTIPNILSQPHNSALTPLERELQTTLVKRPLATSPEENVIQLKTGGQVYTMECALYTSHKNSISACDLDESPVFKGVISYSLQ